MFSFQGLFVLPDANLKQEFPSRELDKIIHDLCQKIAALSEERDKIIHISAPLPDNTDPLEFLLNNTGFRQFYWRGRDQLILAGLDCCVESTGFASRNATEKSFLPVQSLTEANYQPFYLNAFSFNGEAGQGVWQGFPAEYSALPQLCLLDRQGECFLHLHLMPDSTESWDVFKQTVINKLRSLTWQGLPASVNRDSSFAETTSVDRETWGLLCDQVQAEIRNGPLEKVVLARQLSLPFESASPQVLLHKWLQSNPDSYGFMVQLEGKTFLGCSPERLYQRDGDQLYTESLAGTVRRSQDQRADQELAERLLSEPKLVKEHALVSEFIQQQLGPLSQSIEMGAVQSWPLDRIRHAYQPISAQLSKEVSDRALIDALHPTPAICGYPRQVAGRFIAESEGLERGWYSGGIGIIGENYADYAVAIRSAIIENNTLHCYSGVGLVEGADADQEWQELDAKLESLLTVLYGKG